jgi:glycosyltransferase involved in cell wall biosynthesis
MISGLKEAVRNSRIYSQFRAGLQLATQPVSELRVVVCPGDDYPGCAGDLRGIAVARALQTNGWQTLWFPAKSSLQDRQAWLSRFRPHMILFQQNRHPLNDPSLYPGFRCVLDVDDADIIRPAARDHAIAVARGCHSVIAGSEQLADLFRPYNPRVNVVWTGTYLPPEAEALPNRDRGAVLAWSQTTPLHYPEEARFVRELLMAVAARFPNPITALFYDHRDPRFDDFLQPLKQAGIQVRTFPRMRYAAFQATLGRVAIGLHPVVDLDGFSQGKSFGKILTYINAGATCAVSRALDYPKFLRQGENGLMASSLDEWIEACLYLLHHPEDRERMAAQALVDLQQQLTTEVAAAQVSRILAAIVLERTVAPETALAG